MSSDTTTNVQEEINGFVKTLRGAFESLPELILQVILALVVYFIGVKVIGILRKMIRKSMERANVDLGVIQFLDALLKVVLYLILIASILGQFGVSTTSIAALVASGGLAVSMALQGSLSNLAGGVLILLFKPFQVGDYIIEDTHKNEGVVTEIQLFYTRLTTVDNKIIILPNGNLANTSLTNVTREDYRRIEIIVGISYQSDIKMAKEIIQRLLAEDEGVIKDREQLVFVNDLGDSAVLIGCRCWAAMDDYWTTRWRLLENIKESLDAGGIEIPFNQLDVSIKK